MANRFAVNTLVLNKQLVNATGSTLLVNGVSVINGISGDLTQTGSTLDNKINSFSGYSDSIFVHRTGDEIISGIKTFTTGVLVLNSFTQGNGTVFGAYAHAQGLGTKASGNYSHSEGSNTLTYGTTAHSEGVSSIASGDSSHAEGQATKSIGIASHSEGWNTIAENDYSHAEGQYNRTGVSGLFQVGRGNGSLSRSDIIYVSNDSSNPSILSGIWKISTGLRVNENWVITGLIAGTNVTVNNNGDGTFTINSTASGGSSGITQGQLDSLSGYSNTTFATIVTTNLISGNLGTTGQTLYTIVTGLSGQAVLDYATKTNLALTGSNLYNVITGLSGSTTTLVNATGNIAIAHANGIGSILSGNLTVTGQTLYQLMTGLSGQTNTNFATVTNLELTGSNLYITLTGLSGATNALVINSGANEINHANGIGVNLSGVLAQTGSILDNKINSLSGFTTGISGALQAQIGGGGTQVKITGSTVLTNANFTGAGGTTISYDGNYVTINSTSSSSSVAINRNVGFSVDGAGSSVSTGIKGYITVPFTGTISSWNISSYQSGSLSLDIMKAVSGVTPTSSITAGGFPIMSGKQFQFSTGLGGWSPITIAMNDNIGWVIKSSSGITQFTFSLNIQT